MTGDELVEALGRLLARSRLRARALYVYVRGPVREGRPVPLPFRGSMADFVLTDDQTVDVRFQAFDRHGQPARIYGTPQWSSSDPAVLTVTPGPDGLSATVGVPGGNLGRAQVTCRVQRSNNPDDVIMGVQGFEVVSGQAARLGFEIGEPHEAAPTPAPAPEPAPTPTPAPAPTPAPTPEPAPAPPPP